MSEKTEQYIKYSIVTLLCALLFGNAIYAGYTADNNIPVDDSSGLFIACHVICIIQCVLQFLSLMVVPCIMCIKDGDKDNDKSGGASTVFLINIYWLVIYFNYSVSDKYDEFAYVQTVIFFVLLGILVCACIFPIIVLCILSNDNRKSTQVTSDTLLKIAEQQQCPIQSTNTSVNQQCSNV